MSKINVLDETIYNKIAAGEVVERPSSIVKELVENSIDAGATDIVVEIEEGGIKSISVSDNGKGIEKDDVKNAFLPHATSKITTGDDLYNITTLGFRGEALASISSVSRVSMTTKPNNSDFAINISITDSKIDKFNETSRSNGTTIQVSNLFYNTPARLKFLKKPSYEAGDIFKVVGNLVLANPNIKLKYIQDGKVLLEHLGDGILNAISRIYDTKMKENLLETSNEYSGVKCTGYISNKSYTKSNRNFQIFIINGRVVKNATILSAVAQAYSEYLMKNNFPVVFLNIEINPQMIDVNVHPQKQEVRFENNQIVFRAVYGAIINCLSKENKILKFEDYSSVDIKEKTNNVQKSLEDLLSDINKDKDNKELENDNNQIKEIESKNSEDLKTDYHQAILNAGTKNVEFIKDDNEINIKEKTILESNNNDTLSIVDKEALDYKDSPFDNDYTYIGQVFKTYMIIEYKQSIYFIDIHAAHEKILYDKFIEQVNRNSVVTQPLIVPYIFNSEDHCQHDQILNHLDDIRSIGVEIEEFSNDSFKISALPLEIVDMDITKFLKDISINSSNLISNQLGNVIKDNVARRACRAATKANHQMMPNEIKYLLSLIKKQKPIQCPHGRPTILEMTKTDIEKMFKRLV